MKTFKQFLPDWGTDESTTRAKKITPGQNKKSVNKEKKEKKKKELISRV